MAHGNFSDLVALALIAGAVQSTWFVDLLFQDFGPFKATFKAASNSQLDLMIKFASVLVFAVALIFSAVKWNPNNGKMTGLGCFFFSIYVAFSTFQQDNGLVLLRILYVYSAVIFAGGLNVFLFPSNPPMIKTSTTKNNHGNFSDLVALFLILASIATLLYPETPYQDLTSPQKAKFTSNETKDLEILVKFCASLLLIIAMTFSGVKWNPVNGKLSGIGLFVASLYTAYSTFKHDSEGFVVRSYYIFAAALFLGAVHIFAFPSNPLPPKSDDSSAKAKRT